MQGDAVILFDYEEEVNLKSGDYLLIPKYKRHRIIKNKFSMYMVGCHVKLANYTRMS